MGAFMIPSMFTAPDSERTKVLGRCESGAGPRSARSFCVRGSMFGETERLVVDCKKNPGVIGGPSYRSSRIESKVEHTVKRKPIKFNRRKLKMCV